MAVEDMPKTGVDRPARLVASGWPWTTSRLGLLRRSPSFGLLFLATAGSSFGTYLAAIVLTVDIYDCTESGVWVAALLIADFLPIVLIGLLLGPLVDRLSRRWLMIVSDLARFGVFAALPFVDSPAAIVALAGVCGRRDGLLPPGGVRGPPEPRPRRRADERQLAAPDHRDAGLDDRARRRRAHAHGLGPGRAVRGQRRDVPRLGGSRGERSPSEAALRGVADPRPLARRRGRPASRRGQRPVAHGAHRLERRSARKRGDQRRGGLLREGHARRRGRRLRCHRRGKRRRPRRSGATSPRHRSPGSGSAATTRGRSR